MTEELANANPKAQIQTRKSRANSRRGELVALLGVLLIFSLGNSADAFLLLRLADALGDATYVPLMWAAIHVVKASLSTWGGGLSDRFGRKQMIVAGWVVYALVYFGFALSTSAAAFIALVPVLRRAISRLRKGRRRRWSPDLTPAIVAARRSACTTARSAVGALIASILFGYSTSTSERPAAFMTGAALAGVAAVLLSSFRTDTNQRFRCTKFWSPTTTACTPKASRCWRSAAAARRRHVVAPIRRRARSATR